MVVSLRSFDISLVLFVLLACKSCWFLLVALVLVVKCSIIFGSTVELGACLARGPSSGKIWRCWFMYEVLPSVCCLFCFSRNLICDSLSVIVIFVLRFAHSFLVSVSVALSCVA